MSTPATVAAAPPAGLRTQLVDELDPLFLPRIPPHLLARSVEQALRDLRGSVSDEALPEMAVRLARHRLLTTMVEDEQAVAAS
ncbi:MAG TPA: hypothetical protein VMB79_03105 [Jatrophihabitans sp.]|nr:hypothetical protein [Jatrophihabitans sp.]